MSFFDKKKTMKKIFNCLEISGFIKDLKKLPKGIDEIVGERGVSLSGGRDRDYL